MTSTTLRVYAYIFPSRAERVIWTLEELGMTYQLIRLNPLKGETRTPEFLAMNPTARVPVLRHGDRFLTESLAIMEYLLDMSPDAGLLPVGIDERYEYRRALYHGMTEIEAYLWLAEQASSLKAFYHWPDGCAEQGTARAASALEPIWDTLQQRDYITGAEFSLADIYYQHLSRWAMRRGVDAGPQVMAWLSKLESRPAFLRGSLKEAESE